MGPSQPVALIVPSICEVFALYQITVVYGGRHLARVFPGAPRYVVLSMWLHLISLVTVD